MFFIIPTNTDAPIYYRPIGTILLILTNIVCFFLTGGGDGPLADTFILEFANGLHPLQWLLQNFVHFGLGHLIGNMLFLWIFGLVIEGKIGTLRFLRLYLAIGILGGFIEQILMLGYEGLSPGSGGASLAIFGLMMIALLWAPRNEISFVGVFFIRVFAFDLSIMTVSGFYLGTNILSAWMGDFEVGSAMLHLLGAAVGGAIGWLMLQKEWVDCEGWDVVSVWAGNPASQGTFQSYRERKRPYSRTELQDDPAEQLENPERRQKLEKMVQKFRKYVAAQDMQAALEQYRKLGLVQSGDLLTRDDLHELIKLLLDDAQAKAVTPLLEEFIIRFPEGSTRHRLKLVELHLKQPFRPREAQRLLAGVNLDELSKPEHQHVEKMIKRTEQLIADGVFEIG